MNPVFPNITTSTEILPENAKGQLIGVKLKVWDGNIVKNMKTYTKEPAVLLAGREKLTSLIQAIDQRLRE